MVRVKGPNGLVLEFPDDVAAGLLVSGDYSRVEDEPKKPAKKAPAKPKPSEK